MADRLLIHYRLDVARRGTRWACTQTSICKTDNGQLATIDLLCSGFREIKPTKIPNPALNAWGDYDLDNPYPLFAQVQADGPVHEVTLADGHRAWLIVGHEEAKAALTHAALSKDMHAALARDGAVVAQGLPGPAFARHMLSVDPPDHTRLRRLASAAFAGPGWRPSGHVSRPSSTRCWTTSTPPAVTVPSTWSRPLLSRCRSP